MTTEEDFQRQLDAHHDDWQTRLVFADWLDERGDPRAEGYRALGRRRMRPHLRAFSNTPGGMPNGSVHRAYPWAFYNEGMPHHAIIPGDWNSSLPKENLPVPSQMVWKARREAEDAAALGFAQLPAERRAELLALEPVKD